MSVKQPPIELPLAESSEQPASAGLRMTYEEFLAWAGEDTRAEWKDGEVIIQMPPKPRHQILVEFLHSVIGLFVRARNLGQVHIAPLEVKLWEGGPSREPDLVFLSNQRSSVLTPDRLMGAPDLVIEVVSDDSVHRDRVDKLDEYETAGVTEYWIVDNRPKHHRAWFYQRDAAGQYQLVQPDAGGVYHSQVLVGFWLRVEWLWEEQPNELRALAEIVGVEKFADALRKALESK